MKVDASIMVDNPSDAGPAGKALEDSGYDGAFVFDDDGVELVVRFLLPPLLYGSLRLNH